MDTEKLMDNLKSYRRLILPPTSGFVQLGLDVVAIIGSAYPGFIFGVGNSAMQVVLTFGF
jgi:hypothetical protein